LKNSLNIEILKKFQTSEDLKTNKMFEIYCHNMRTNQNYSLPKIIFVKSGISKKSLIFYVCLQFENMLSTITFDINLICQKIDMKKKLII
jgi:hypothetical protein